MCPLIFGALGAIQSDTCTINIIKSVPKCEEDPNDLMLTIQKAVIIGTLHLVRLFFNAE